MITRKLETILWQLCKTRLQTCMCPPSFGQKDPLKVLMTPLWMRSGDFSFEKMRDGRKERKREVLNYTLWKHLVKGCVCGWRSDPFQPVCLSWCCLHVRLMHKFLFELRGQWQKKFKRLVNTLQLANLIFYDMPHFHPLSTSLFSWTLFRSIDQHQSIH